MDVRPYLIFPKLIEQPTWGGKYIGSYKGWSGLAELKDKNIGQSYELYGSSVLSSAINDSAVREFGPESLHTTDGFSLNSLTGADASSAYGPYVFETYGKMPLLIKFTQAKGNSFQLHKKPDVEDPDWLPKAESWYFFEDGYITFGLKQGTSPEDYKHCCIEINQTMQQISQQIISQQLSYEDGVAQAKMMIKEKNPWQYVNVLHVPKLTMLDLSGGGLHHSWEEDPSSSLGNIVYEVQQDAPDDTSTLRSFDQGKIKSDGTIRPLTIEQYFRFLDTDADHNNVEQAKQFPHGTRILTTKNYYMDLYDLTDEQVVPVGDSFAHLFIREGDANITAGNTTVRLTKGHSCFIPHAAGSFTILPNTEHTIIIRTGIEKNS